MYEVRILVVPNTRAHPRLRNQPSQMAINDAPAPADAGIQPVFQGPVFLSMNFCIFEFEGAWFFYFSIYTYRGQDQIGQVPWAAMIPSSSMQRTERPIKLLKKGAAAKVYGTFFLFLL